MYAGKDPLTGRQSYLTETIRDSPEAQIESQRVRERLVRQVRERRQPPTKASMNDLLDRHLVMQHLADSTRSSHKYTARKHIRPLLGRSPLTTITAEVLDSFYAELLRCRAHCTRNMAGHMCRPLSPATVRDIHYLISGAFRRAVRWGWVDRNPAHEAAPPVKRPPDPQPPTPEEAARILRTVWPSPDLGPLVWMAMVTGARRGELCALRWRHFDADRQVLMIRASIAQVRGQVWEKDTKLHQRRHVALDPATTAMLAAYHAARRDRAAEAGFVLTPDAFMFSLSPHARTPWLPSSLTQRYRRVVTRLGIPTTLHKLRHFSATTLLVNGVDVRTVAARLGHAQPGTTLAFYTAWVSEADQRASRTLMQQLPLPTTPIAITAPRPARTLCPYEQIADHLRSQITNGALPPGTFLPTTKELATRHHVAPSTAHRVSRVKFLAQFLRMKGVPVDLADGSRRGGRSRGLRVVGWC